LIQRGGPYRLQHSRQCLRINTDVAPNKGIMGGIQKRGLSHGLGNRPQN